MRLAKTKSKKGTVNLALEGVGKAFKESRVFSTKRQDNVGRKYRWDERAV